VIRATGEGGSAILYLGTPFNATTSGFKLAIIAEGQSTWSRSKLHFCMENTATDAPNATVSDARMTILSDGKIGIGNITPSQILQVGYAGRLRIANDITDYSLLGAIDSDGATNTRIVISGRDRGGANANGNIEHISTGTLL